MSLGGGMAVQRAVAERWKQVTGKPLIEAYGLTETSPGACINPLVAGAEYNGFAGLPISSTIVTHPRRRRARSCRSARRARSASPARR